MPGERSGSRVRRIDGFAEFAEAFCAGFIACREGLTDDDGEAYMRGLMAAYEQSGRQRARHVIEAMGSRS